MAKPSPLARKKYPAKGLLRTVVWLRPETKDRLRRDAEAVGATLSRFIALRLGDLPKGKDAA